MSKNLQNFEKRVAVSGSVVTYHRETGGTACLCLSSAGFRDLRWHKENPSEPMCNERGMLNPTVVEIEAKAFIQLVQAGAVRRMQSEYITGMFPGEIQINDHVGIFPLTFGGIEIDFMNWSQSGEEYVMFRGRRFLVVCVNLVPDPADGNPHHFEVGLRLITTDRNVT